MQTLLQDLQFAFRQLRRAPGFALTAILTVALGIGANTAIFTLVHAVLLRNLPVPDPAHIIRVGAGDDCCITGSMPSDQKYSLFSTEMYLQFRDNAPEFEQLAAMPAAIGNGTSTARRASSNEAARPLKGSYVSGNYFALFALPPASGRLITAADDQLAAPPVAVMSYATWTGEYQSDPTVVGATFLLDSKPVAIIGIAAPAFYGDRIRNAPQDFYLPLATETYFNTTPVSSNPKLRYLYLLGRVKSSTDISALQTRLTALLRNYLATRPAYQTASGKQDLAKVQLTLGPGGMGIDQYQSKVSSGLHTLTLFSALVLLIACANIANLLLARGLTRRSETAVRLALGASRARLIRQSLTESLTLSLAGAAVGIAVAFLGTRMILLLAFPQARNLPITATPSAPVLAFTLALAILTALVFGAAPAYVGSRAQPSDALRGNNRSSRDASSLPRRTLVVLQATLSLTLLTVAGLLTRSLSNAMHQDFGLATEDRLVLHLDPQSAGYTAERIAPLMHQLSEGMLAIPGIKQVGYANYSPLEGNAWGEAIDVEGRADPDPHADIYATWDRISPGFIALTGQHLLRGRDLAESDRTGSPGVAVVNASFARKFFPGEDGIGRHFGTGDKTYPYEIVGIVADAKFADPASEIRPMFFRSLLQLNPKADPKDMGERASVFPHAILILTSGGGTAPYEAQLRQVVAATNPNLAIQQFATFEAQIAEQLDSNRVITRLTVSFGLLALILAAIGLYGVTAYTVNQRIPEIGLRLALGADRLSVVSLVLRGAMSQSLFGLLIGIPVAILSGHLLQSQLFGIRGTDPLTVLGAAALLSLSTLLAALLPARRAAFIEPTEALRSE